MTHLRPAVHRVSIPAAFLAALVCVFVVAARGEQAAVSILGPTDAWTFDYGREFPGATGGLTADTEAQRDGRAALKLVGDFSKGGNYVQAGRKIEKIDPRELALWLRNPAGDRLVVRLGDASGQTHQFNFKIEPSPDWQRVVLPLERFFARRGETDAVTSITKYESWGGAKDGLWHGPATAIYILLSKGQAGGVRTLWIGDVTLLPRPTEVAGADVRALVPLDEIIEGSHEWGFSRGEEFPGAKGSLAVVKDEPAAGQSCLKLAGDFTGGGGYVAMIKTLNDLDAKDVAAIRLRMKTGNAASFGVQLVDATGQTHQRRDVPITPDGQWHDVVLKPAEIAGGEHWGGANDGRWHGPATQVAFSLSGRSDEKAKQPVVLLADIRAEVVRAVFRQPPAFRCDFEGAAPLAPAWTLTGGAAVDSKAAFKGAASLVLDRPLEAAERPCSAVGPTFPVAPGQWEIGLACKADLHSPDNSYNAVVQLELLDAAGKVTDRLTVADVFGRHEWQAVTKRVELPKGVAAARFQVQLNKTYGRFWLDDLSAAYLAPAPLRDDRIARVLFSTAQLGNLLFPNDPRRVSMTVEARKPLRDAQRTVSWVVRDYWGAEQTRPAAVTLGAAEKKGDRLVYAAEIDLAGAALEVGRYCEVHVAIPQEGAEPFRAATSLAILPEAGTKRYKPEEVPFTSRNWDDRISEYVRLSDRLGVRICGIWGTWSAKPPYKAEAPALDLAQQLGMGWITNTPIHKMERGDAEYDETALRQGVRNLIEKFGSVRPMIINLGNEPHGTGERVRANVAAYKAVYEEVKKVDPTITVVATSVEANEEYFKAGYGRWCDAYDFHIYGGDAEDVRGEMEKYKVLMAKYGPVRPLWSTELGLNSQGMARHRVAAEVMRKFAIFFANGGVSASWFCLLYPDREGKNHGGSTDAHNVFDSRYNRYAPRLDAIAYYNAVNAIAIKKFVAEKAYPGGVRAFLFRDRDNRSLQVLWMDKGRRDVLVPLAGVGAVQAIRLDGSLRALDAGGRGLTLSLDGDPLLLLYDGGPAALAAELEPPAAALESPPAAFARRGPTTLTVAASGAAADALDLIAPPFWTVKKSAAPGQGGKATVTFTLTPPETTEVREVDLTVPLRGPDGRRQGELYYRAPIGD